MKKIFFIVLFFWVVMWRPVFVFSQDSESVPPSVSTTSAINDKKEFLDKLKQLKETDPEAFRELVGQHFQNQRQQYKQLRENNPEEFQRRVERKKAHLSERMKWLEENKPQEYQRLKQQVSQNKESRFLEEKKPWFKRRKAQEASGNFNKSNAPNSSLEVRPIHRPVVSGRVSGKRPRPLKARPFSDRPQRP